MVIVPFFVKVVQTAGLRRDKVYRQITCMRHRSLNNFHKKWDNNHHLSVTKQIKHNKSKIGILEISPVLLYYNCVNCKIQGII